MFNNMKKLHKNCFVSTLGTYTTARVVINIYVLYFRDDMGLGKTLQCITVLWYVCYNASLNFQLFNCSSFDGHLYIFPAMAFCHIGLAK